MITFTEMKVRLTLTDEALGMAPKDRNVYEAYIASLAPDAETAEEEVARLGTEEAMDGRTKVFPRTEDGKPFLYDYQIRGMFKDSIGFLRRATGSECGKLKAYKKVVDGMIFVKDRINPFEVKGEMGVCQRPMRTAGPQGERVALAASESIPAQHRVHGAGDGQGADASGEGVSGLRRVPRTVRVAQQRQGPLHLGGNLTGVRPGPGAGR